MKTTARKIVSLRNGSPTDVISQSLAAYSFTLTQLARCVTFQPTNFAVLAGARPHAYPFTYSQAHGKGVHGKDERFIDRPWKAGKSRANKANTQFVHALCFLCALSLSDPSHARIPNPWVALYRYFSSLLNSISHFPLELSLGAHSLFIWRVRRHKIVFPSIQPYISFRHRFGSGGTLALPLPVCLSF